VSANGLTTKSLLLCTSDAPVAKIRCLVIEAQDIRRTIAFAAYAMPGVLRTTCVAVVFTSLDSRIKAESGHIT